jgi:hypothetical protein
MPLLYEETNGIDGLQHGGTDSFGERDPCTDYLPPDTLLFF